MMNHLTVLSTVSPDKLGHFTAGVLIYAAFHFLNPVLGILAVSIAAIGKEIYDYLHKENHTPDVWDAVTTILGGVAGFISGL